MFDIQSYFADIFLSIDNVECSNSTGVTIPIATAIDWSKDQVISLRNTSNKIMLIGNGGSMGIASHFAIDFTKNCGIAAVVFSDAAALTCVSNDLGYDQVFARQIEVHGQKGDLLIAISSSGHSPNILNGVDAGKATGCDILTLSGFQSNNPLRNKGNVNFYVPSTEYGKVEVSHMALIHAIVDCVLD